VADYPGSCIDRHKYPDCVYGNEKGKCRFPPDYHGPLWYWSGPDPEGCGKCAQYCKPQKERDPRG
jgi:hypothetical protein